MCAVHRDDEVVVVEPLATELTGAVHGCVVTARGQRLSGATIGLLPHVPIADAGAPHLDLVSQSRACDQRAHHDLGRRRTADVAGADEADAHHRASRMSVTVPLASDVTTSTTKRAESCAESSSPRSCSPWNRSWNSAPPWSRECDRMNVCISVSTTPGRTALAVTPVPSTSRARCKVNMSSAALLEL